MRKHATWITIVLVLCACSATPPTEPSAPAASSARTATSASASTTSSAFVSTTNPSATVDAGSATALPSAASTAAPSASSTAAATLGGSVWRDVCDSGSEGQPPPTTTPPGCVPGAAGGFVADGIRATNEPPIAKVRVTLGTGACPATPTGSTATDGEGRWTFPDLLPGTYCVAVNALDEANLPLLLPGGWTAPPGAYTNPVVSATVALGAGEQRTDISWGWDYQLLP